MNKEDLYVTRDYQESDHNFVYATWLRGLYYGDSWFSLIPKDVFMEEYQKVISAILGLPNTKVKVTCLKEDPEVILGYAVMNVSESTLHWCFVKKSWRKIGVAKSLINSSTKVVTHLTKEGLGIMVKKCPDVEFNPFAVNKP